MVPNIPTVCVDLDGTLAQYDGWKGIHHIGDPITGSREFLSSIRAMPAFICIHTTRANTDASRAIIETWLLNNHMPYDMVSIGGKPYAKAYVDDRAVACRPQESDQAYEVALLQIQELIHKC